MHTRLQRTVNSQFSLAQLVSMDIHPSVISFLMYDRIKFNFADWFSISDVLKKGGDPWEFFQEKRIGSEFMAHLSECDRFYHTHPNFIMHLAWGLKPTMEPQHVSVAYDIVARCSLALRKLENTKSYDDALDNTGWFVNDKFRPELVFAFLQSVKKTTSQSPTRVALRNKYGDLVDF